MATRTQSKLDDINVRAWSIGGTMVRRYHRYLRGKVRLSSNPQSKNGWVEEVVWDSLSPSDQAWIFDTQSHDWQYLRLQGEQSTRALIWDWPTSRSSIILLTEDGKQLEVPSTLPSALD